MIANIMNTNDINFGKNKYMNLSYKLCKQLKDIGFPQDKWFTEGNWYYDEKTQKKYMYIGTTTTNTPKPKEHSICIPSLPKLIKECGDGFECLSRRTIVHDLNGDKNTIWKTVFWCQSYDIPESISRGNTPKIAVANLYIKLNAKTSQKIKKTLE